MPSKRRSVGAAFERSPSEKMGEWGTRNLLNLLAALIVAFLFWTVTSFAIDGFFNDLANGWDDSKPRRFDSDDPHFIAFKIIGSLICIWLVCRRTTK